MIVEMNPQDEEGFGPNNDDDFVSDVEPDTGLNGEPDSESGFVPDAEYVPRGSELREELSGILSLASELESVNYLSDPKNNYASHRRAELQSRLSSELNKLQGYKAKLSREVLRCEKNLDRIRTDSEKLNLAETRECYSDAEDQQQKQLDEVVCDREAVSWAISKVQAALRSSRGGGFGVGGQFGPASPNGSSPWCRNGPVRLGNEVDGLLSFGPLGQKKDN